MTQAQLVNQEYARWKEASGSDRELRQLSLVKSLEKLALSICWRRIPDLRSEFTWVANEAIWRAISGENKFGAKSQFSVWFYRIVVNECNRLLKHTKASRNMAVGLDAVDLVAKDVFPVTTIEIQGLSIEDRLLIISKDEGWSTAEIAGMLETTEAAVKMRWSRLKGRLRDGRV